MINKLKQTKKVKARQCKHKQNVQFFIHLCYIEFDFRKNVFHIDTIILKHFKAHFTNLPNK